MKRTLSALFAVMMLFSLSVPAFAANETIDGITYIYVDSVEDSDWEHASSDIAYLVPNENVPDFNDGTHTATQEDEVVLFGITPPTKPEQEWNIKTKGPYDFDGSIEDWVYNLYTDFYFVGKETYSIVCKNSYDDTVRMEAKDYWGFDLHKTWDITAGHTLYAFIDKADDISTTTKWYLAWFAPANVSGTVK